MPSGGKWIPSSCGGWTAWGRSLKHLITLLDELQALGVGFVSLNEGIDLQTPAGRLQVHILAALSEFERCRIAERVQARLARAWTQGKRLGRPYAEVPRDRIAAVEGLPLRQAAAQLKISIATLKRWRRRAREAGSG